LGDGFGLTAQVQSPIDAGQVCRYMHTALASLVQALEQAPSTPLHQLEVLPPQERTQLLVDWNGMPVDYPQDQCIHQLFEAQVSATPDAIALLHEGQQLSYDELNHRANRLARHLRTLGVVPDARVAICMERSTEMVVAILAVMKAGGAYVPLDPDYPVERLVFMLTDSMPVAVLTHPQTGTQVRAALAFSPGIQAQSVIDVQADAQHWSQEPEDDLTPLQTATPARHLAYVIYTSGSTGQPKGVMNEHRSVVNRLLWMQDAYRLGGDEALLQKTPFSFDVSVWEF
ncbi:AMP-binding protein, partial [Herbaspirillum sp. GCM10030257]|uniref:AMP-binding protein n=1 Tax=Herbaspirillum sp. GCM10030257 TaxID=3273393 RepID=UPI00360D329C